MKLHRLWIGLALFLLPGAVPITLAQEAVGICGGTVCGPAGAFTVADFPTIALVDFTAFPSNPARHYTPRDGGRAWYVAPTGNDYNEGSESAPFAAPERAVALAASGDVIWVGDGTYAIGGDEYEAITLSLPAVTFAAVHPGQVIFTPRNEINAVGLSADADNLVIDGFILRGFRSYGVSFGRLDSPQQNLVLMHLIVEGSQDAIRSVVAPTTPHVRPVIEGLLLYDVSIREAANSGFNCGEGPCNNLRLEALRVEMPGGDGENSGADAIAVEEGDNIVVFNADISGASADGLDFKAARVAVANVIVHDVIRNGIKLWRGGDIINALVYNTGADAAIVFDRGAEYRMLNSTVSRHAWPLEAYVLTAAYDHPDEPGHLAIINSIFYQNYGAVWVSPAFTLDVRNSLFAESPGAALEWRDLAVGNVEQGYSPINTVDSAGAGCCNLVAAESPFSNPDAGDYTLASESPAIDAGTDAVNPYIAFDLYGNPRLSGAAVDLGAIEKN
jgi:hypothetical protein